MATDYEFLLDQVIEIIRSDNEADSATIERLVERLHELQAAGIGSLIAGDGLSGGGSLDSDVTLSLSEESLEYVRRAARAVTPEGLEAELGAYLTESAARGAFAAKADVVESHVVTFSVPGAVNGQEVSPPLALPGAYRITSVGVAVGTPNQSVTVSFQGGASGTMTVPAGVASRVATVESGVVGSFRVSVESTSSAGVTVAVRVEKVS